MADPLPDAILVPTALEGQVLAGQIGQRSSPELDVAYGYDAVFRPLLNPASRPVVATTGDPLARRSIAVRVRDSGAYRFLSLDVRARPRDSQNNSYYRWVEQIGGEFQGVLFGYLIDPDVKPYPGVNRAPLLPPAPPDVTLKTGATES